VSAPPPLRVCLVIDRLDVAGGPRFFEHLARGLAPARFRLTVATAPGSPLRDVFREAGVQLEAIPFARPLEFRTLIALLRLFRQGAFDIVHSMGLRADFHARLAARLTGHARVVTTVAMLARGFDALLWRRMLYQIAERVSERWVNTFLVDSEYVCRQLVEGHRIPASRVRKVYIGADPVAFDPDRANGARVRRELGLGPGPLVGSLGRLVSQKGHEDFLDAMAMTVRRIPDLQALVVGEGPLGPALRTRAEAIGVAGCTRFLGARRDLADLLSALDVLVIASNLESIPVLLFEAMALARPIVATTVGGIPEVVEDKQHALLVPPRDPVAISRAIEAALENPGASAAMGRRARDRVIQQFNTQDCVDAVAQCYREVVAPPTHRG